MTSLINKVSLEFNIEEKKSNSRSKLTKILLDWYGITGSKFFMENTFRDEIIHEYKFNSKYNFPPSEFEIELDIASSFNEIYTYGNRRNRKIGLRESFLKGNSYNYCMSEQFRELEKHMGRKNLRPERLSAFSRSIIRAILRMEGMKTTTKITKWLRNPKIKIRNYLYRLEKRGYIERRADEWNLTVLGELYIDMFLTVKVKKEPKNTLRPTFTTKKDEQVE